MNGLETFCGATIQLFQTEVLIVLVASRLLGDRIEAPLVVAAFQAKFDRTIVLAAQDTRGVPTFFGPGPIAEVLARIPFDALGWKRFRLSRPKPLMLPIPSYPLPEDLSSYVGSRSKRRETLGEDAGATRR